MKHLLTILCCTLTACATTGSDEQNRAANLQRLRAVQAYLCATNPYNCPAAVAPTTTVCSRSVHGDVVCSTR